MKTYDFEIMFLETRTSTHQTNMFGIRSRYVTNKNLL